MADRKPIFWTRLKTTGELRYQERRPLNRPYVEEHSQEIEWQWYQYRLILVSAAGLHLRTEILDTHCGYDRGVKKPGLIKRMLGDGL